MGRFSNFLRGSQWIVRILETPIKSEALIVIDNIDLKAHQAIIILLNILLS